MTKDQRKAKRRNMRYTAWVAVEPGRLLDCQLNDISETGCRIDIDDSQPIPDRFVLLLVSNGSARRNCRVMWRKPREIGVSFEANRATGAQ